MAPNLIILGAGASGLSAALRGMSHGLDCHLLESASRAGGLARTFVDGDFRFDSGPHRFHDRSPQATRLVRELLGADLLPVDAPSRIWLDGRFYDFPLRPSQVFKGPWRKSSRRVLSFAMARARRSSDTYDNFEAWAHAAFGRALANAFLIPFSEKLWGAPAANLSTEIAGRRLPKFDLPTVIGEMLGWKRGESEGRFYYPRLGFGQIVDQMAARVPSERLHLATRIVGLRHDGRRIFSIELAEGTSLSVADQAVVISTLPILPFLQMLDPGPPPELFESLETLRFRSLVLVTLFVDRPQVSDAACLYFPDPKLRISRVHEPRVRSHVMSPVGKTSLVAELPCQEGDATWSASDASLEAETIDCLARLRLIEAREVMKAKIVRLPHAYPVLTNDYAGAVERVRRFLAPLENLRIAGRGSFRYASVHDFIDEGIAIADEVAGQNKKKAALGCS